MSVFPPHLSNIPWTDFTAGALNPVIGCTKKSEGCLNCYAEATITRAGRDFSKVSINYEKLRYLWNWKPVEHVYRRGPGSKPLAFILDLSDLFHDSVPDALIEAVFDLIVARQDIDWQVLTKRPERAVRDGWNRRMAGLGNLWFGVTVENQRRAEERIPLLLQLDPSVRFLSIEPMLERIDLGLDGQIAGKRIYSHAGDLLDWVIVGAESGPKRRPFDRRWADDIYRQVRRYTNIAFFGKQDSAQRPGRALILEGGKVVREFPRPKVRK